MLQCHTMSFPVHEHCKKMATQEDGKPWWAAFPEPVSRPDHIKPEELFAMLEEQQKSPEKPRDFLLVDVRRTDWTGGTVAGSINLPAHSFYPTIRSIYGLCKQASVKKVIFYCSSSNGRGPRCAAWMQDFINEAADEGMKSLVLTGGIKGWVKSYEGLLMDDYDARVWQASG